MLLLYYFLIDFRATSRVSFRVFQIVGTALLRAEDGGDDRLVAHRQQGGATWGLAVDSCGRAWLRLGWL